MNRPSEPGFDRVRRTACSAALGLAVIAGCAKHEPPGVPTPAASELVASIGTATLTVAEVEARLREKPPFARARYAEQDKKQEFVEEQIRAEVLAAEAERRGLASDPDVLRATKRLMVAKLFEREFEPKWKPESVPDGAVEKYYREHTSEFKQAEQVRVLELVVHDPATADRVAKAIHERAAPPGDTKTFSSLVARYSEDEASQAKGGEVPFFERGSSTLARPLVDAAFELARVGNVTPPVPFDGGFALLMLVQRRPGFERSFAEVSPEIRQRLFVDLRQKALDAFIADLIRKSKVERHPENLDRIVVGGPPLAASAPR